MVCHACGSPMEGAFCSHCGAPAVVGANAHATPQPPYAVAPNPYAAPPMLMSARVPRHLQTLGVLWCVYAAYRAAAGIFAMLFLAGISTPAILGGIGARGLPFLPFAPVMSGLAVVAGVFILCTSALSFITGYALLTRRPWGRTLAIVAAILSLIKLPVGTALGIYTLWVLAPAASGFEYDALADRS
jgi:hypothetical protein